MRKLLNWFNRAIIAGCFVAGLATLDPLALVASALLFTATFNPRCNSLYYLMLVYNLHFSMRYIALRLLGFEDVFDQPKLEVLGAYFLLSALMYVGVVIAINTSTRRDRSGSLEYSASLGKVGAVSMLIFSAVSLAGQYSIGREIANPVSRLLIRLSLFLQYWMPAIFFLKNWLLYAPIYIVAMLVFGSKAFLYNLILLAILYGVIVNVRVKLRHVLAVLLGGVLSILLFEVILQYRLTKKLEISEVGSLSVSLLSNPEVARDTLSRVTTRWAGLDTLAAYGQADFRYSVADLGREAIIAVNNLLPVFKIPLAEHYMSSQFLTAYLFRGYSFFDVAQGELTHVDSMFGLSRFIAVEFGAGMILYVLFLLFPFVFQSRDYLTDTLMKTLFFASVLLGGSYSETFRILFEFSIIFVLLRLRSVRSVLKYKQDRSLTTVWRAS